jgi:hypothetical protein
MPIPDLRYKWSIAKTRKYQPAGFVAYFISGTVELAHTTNMKQEGKRHTAAFGSRARGHSRKTKATSLSKRHNAGTSTVVAAGILTETKLATMICSCIPCASKVLHVLERVFMVLRIATGELTRVHKWMLLAERRHVNSSCLICNIQQQGVLGNSDTVSKYEYSRYPIKLIRICDHSAGTRT